MVLIKIISSVFSFLLCRLLVGTILLREVDDKSSRLSTGKSTLYNPASIPDRWSMHRKYNVNISHFVSKLLIKW